MKRWEIASRLIHKGKICRWWNILWLAKADKSGVKSWLRDYDRNFIDTRAFLEKHGRKLLKKKG